MTQIVVTLDKNADTTLLRRMIENMKGVLGTSIEKRTETPSQSKSDAWLEKLHSIKRDIDPSFIDMDDERTRYIMSK